MLAKELKIKTLKKQREFIKEHVKNGDGSPDGDTSYIFIGYVYPEVIEYFHSEGINAEEIKSDILTAITGGRPIYLFTVGDVTLTEEEYQEAEAYNVEASDDASNDEVSDIIQALLRRRF